MTPLDDVSTFIDRLAELPAQSWIDIGLGIIARAKSAGRPEAAIAIIDATLAAEGLVVAAWYARDAVETSAFVVSRVGRRWTPAERSAVAATESAAIQAASALLVRDKLSSDDFVAVTGPFADLILLPSQQVL